jgi:hypothetical protein
MPSSAFGVSSQTKAKLKGFQFVEKAHSNHPQPAMNEAQKENASIQDVEKQQKSGDFESPSKPSLTENVTMKSPHPKTPVTRLPLADLIANTEDVFNRQPTRDMTPVDRILWQHGPTSSEPNSYGTPVRRGKKRARSSSPASSQNDISSHFQGNGSFDLQPLSKQLKTSLNDPVADLWNRYAEGNMKKRDNLPNLGFAHLISSPQTPGKRRDGTGLQRSASLGMEWPMSKAKRRRIQAEESVDKVKDKFARARSDLLEPGKSKASKVSLLVEKIQESLHRAPRPDPEAPSSSSPLPERTSNNEGSSLSPTRPNGINIRSVHHDETPCPNDADRTFESEIFEGDGGSSEYGGADFDMDLVEAVERGEALDINHGLGLVNGKHQVAEQQVFEVADEGDEDIGLPNPTVTSNVNALLENRMPQGDSFDEFDDDDEDFIAEIEVLAAKYDSQPNQPVAYTEQNVHDGAVQPLKQSCPIPQPHQDAGTARQTQPAYSSAANLNFDSDDEFGDDVDLESLVAIENALGKDNMGNSGQSRVCFQS